MKKILALIMAGCMALSLAACSGDTSSAASDASSTTSGATSEASNTETEAVTDIAFVTDVGNIDDQSFNRGQRPGCQLLPSHRGL